MSIVIVVTKQFDDYIPTLYGAALNETNLAHNYTVWVTKLWTDFARAIDHFVIYARRVIDSPLIRSRHSIKRTGSDTCVYVYWY